LRVGQGYSSPYPLNISLPHQTEYTSAMLGQTSKGTSY